MPPPAAAPPPNYSTWDVTPKYSTWDAAPKYLTSSTGIKSPSYTLQGVSSASASPPAAVSSPFAPPPPRPQSQILSVEREIHDLTNKVDSLQQQLQQTKRAQEAFGDEASVEARAAARMLTDRIRAEWIEAREELERLSGRQWLWNV